MMTEVEMTRMEARVRTAATTFRYPPTPDIAASVRRRIPGSLATKPVDPRAARRRWATAAILVALALVALLSVPQVRAGLLEVIQIGVIRILLASPTPAPTATGTPTLTPQPTPTLITSLLDIAGETTLVDAQQKANFTILLPAYPTSLGAPDHVFVQDLGGPLVVLVWVDPDRPDKPILSIHQFGPGTSAEKVAPTVVATTTVNGHRALWTEGPYVLIHRNGEFDVRRLISGHVLIWEEGGITYRVESDLPMEEAVKVGESLK